MKDQRCTSIVCFGRRETLRSKYLRSTDLYQEDQKRVDLATRVTGV